MATTAERMRMTRSRRRESSLRELRLVIPDPNAASVRERVARQVAALDPMDEEEAMRWIESVSEFDEPDAELCDAAR